jgi:UDP:flavonoid glycosyltransferase YjiC (YdhE family)
VRLLFSFVGGSGHFEPLLPVARAAAAAGHEVAATGEPLMMPVVEAAGLVGYPSGPNLGGTRRMPLLDLDPEREDRDLRDGFARRTAPQRARDILALCERWRPDVIVCDEADFGAMIAAECRRLPYATVLVTAAGLFLRPALLGDALTEVRAGFGLPPDPDLTMLSRHLVLSPFPPGFRDPAYPLPATAWPLRPAVVDPLDPPAWLPDRCVYFTLGTVFNMESGNLFDRVLTGLGELPVALVVTVGRHIDPADFGPQPAHVRIERYVPQAAILPRCAAVVSHGGSGSVTGALAYGLPSVLLPMGADQPLNAARCAQLGVSRVLDAGTATPAQVREAASAVLADPAYRRAAEQIRAGIAAMPGPDEAVRRLERLMI